MLIERKYLKIGVAGPVGSGKTALIERLSRAMIHEYALLLSPTIFTQKKMQNS